MEAYDLIINAISTIGFPIVMCAALFWKMNQMDKLHKEEMTAVTDALKNNTIAITELRETVADLAEKQ